MQFFHISVSSLNFTILIHQFKWHYSIVFFYSPNQYNSILKIYVDNPKVMWTNRTSAYVMVYVFSSHLINKIFIISIFFWHKKKSIKQNLLFTIVHIVQKKMNLLRSVQGARARPQKCSC